MDGRAVLVCTEYEDPTADLVIAELSRRRVPVVRLDPGRDFPASVTLAVHIGGTFRAEAGTGWGGRLTVGERSAEISAVRALYHRRPSPYPTGASEQAARFAAQENRRGLGGVLGALPGCLYLSHPQSVARAEYKPAQLDAAARGGFAVPATLVTNDPGEAKAFCAQQPCVYKPLHAGTYAIEGEPAGIWAATVEAGEIDGSVSRSAHLFQARVPKIADVRAVVVGERAFCARITAPPGVVDWRSVYGSLTYEPFTCPDTMREILVRFLAEFGLLFGAFDFAVTADGTWWFLECNPNGQWAWLEEAAGLPITNAIADLLERGADGE
ncbi:ATP-grasp ribosomal peptide maturase [Actinacidiphila sp. DG2A-62]|uniref:ATP-grasp ribosomal peptide maturase n=1 Tax=Actinacidiphila sp. DG2A-62 TaxID=3108821 RepID=UPI002DB57230|nr:ATP-grasp ribosomal peptide maturase [Actinacidiphila sp. DG2A-62]MEC3995837.1 ATP-grasp ribosomal peptide maturase [Actinacidiphila sp. DG2A-62]